MTVETNSETMESVRARMSGRMDLRELAGREADYVRSRGDLRLNAIYSDSRRVTPGSAFFALPGLRTNGTDCLPRRARA